VFTYSATPYSYREHPIGALARAEGCGTAGRATRVGVEERVAGSLTRG
jgi:hypothetical protein